MKILKLNSIPNAVAATKKWHLLGYVLFSWTAVIFLVPTSLGLIDSKQEASAFAAVWPPTAGGNPKTQNALLPLPRWPKPTRATVLTQVAYQSSPDPKENSSPDSPHLLDTPQQKRPDLRPASPPPVKLPAEINEDVMAEIQAIRKQIGSGIGESLQGIGSMTDLFSRPNPDCIKIAPQSDPTDLIQDPPNPAQALFEEQLRSVIAEAHANAIPPNAIADTIANAGDPPPAQSAAPNVSTSAKVSTPDPCVVDHQSHNLKIDKTAELRRCARALEEVAGRLETVTAYEAADRIRSQASALWTQARKP
jgi:hypothetical protein